jgi:hypothetical protein
VIEMATQLVTGPASTGRGARKRPMRNTRMVALRSSLPTGLVTLRHDVPEYLRPSTPDGESTEVQQDATPKVEKARVTVRAQVRIETAARKGS